MKKLFCLAMVVLVLVSLCSCGQGKSNDMGYYIYDVAREESLDADFLDSSRYGDSLYILGKQKSGCVLISLSLKDKSVAKTVDLSKDYEHLAAVEGYLWISEKSSVDKLDLNGAVLDSVSASGNVVDLACDGDGRLYAATKKETAVFSAAGEILSTLPNAEGYETGNLVALGGGGVASYASRLRAEVPEVNRLEGDKTEPLPGAYNPGQATYEGDDKYDYYYAKYTPLGNTVEAGVQICGYDLATLAETPLFDTAGLPFQGEIMAVYAQGGSYFMAVGGYDGKTTLLKFDKTEHTKKILTVGRMESNLSVTRTIADFNAATREYYAVSKNYFGQDDLAETHLNLDIAAGEQPDVMSVMLTTYDIYADKGLLVNMYPLLDKDPDISREDILPSVLRSLEWSGGQLYQMCPYFALSTCCEHESVVGDVDSWNLEDLYAICQQYPEMTLYMNQWGSRLINFLIGDLFSYFADIPNNQYRFNSPEFIEFLEFLKEMSDRAREFQPEMNDYTEGRVLLTPLNFSTMDDYKAFVQSESFNEIRVTGFPSQTGTGCHITAPVRIAIFAGTGNEEAAWQFIKAALSNERQMSVTDFLPVTVSAMESVMEQARVSSPATTVTKYVDPEGAAAGTNLETRTYSVPEMVGLTDDQVELFYDILERSDSVYQDAIESPYITIIADECDALFAGDKSAAETAALIQSKLEIYFAERQ
ncbi:MAG: extracellular solute-binding protein [Lentisphaerae bacterium]|nr:extracellular solute-binding protein [Lentisphaerota bacterium]